MIKTITLESRPRLQICNAFVRLENEVNPKSIKIKLLEKSIEITVENNAVKFLTEAIEFIPNSLLGLNVTKNWICFRAQIKSDFAFGCFQAEVITNPTPNINILKSSIEHVKLLKNHNCNVTCACCKNVLSKKIFVKRVLPIPDMDYDLNDWFCCKHNHTTVDQNLTPLESDILYGSFFFTVRTSLFNSNLKTEGNSIFCNRCLQHIGKPCTNSSFKLWSCSVEYNILSNSEIKRPFATDPFTDFLIAIKTSMTGMIGEEIVLQSYIGKNIHSLTLKPMDWQLNLMIEPKTISKDRNITLRTITVVKALYKYQVHKGTALLVDKTYCEVGYLVIKAGLEHLLSSTKRFPKPHRIASDFYIGHLYLDNQK